MTKQISNIGNVCGAIVMKPQVSNPLINHLINHSFDEKKHRQANCYSTT